MIAQRAGKLRLRGRARVVMALRQPTVSAILTAVVLAGGRLLAQPATVPPTFEAKTDLGLVRVVEVARLKTFDPEEIPDPCLRVTLRIEMPEAAPPEIGTPTVKAATDDTGASLVPAAGARMPGGVRMAGAARMWVGMGGGGGKLWTERIVTLIAPEARAMTLRSLSVSLPYTAVTNWGEIHLDAAQRGADSMKAKDWAQVSLQDCRVSGEAGARQLEATLRLKRVEGHPGVSVYSYQYLARSAAGKEVRGALYNTGGGRREGLDLHVRWAGVPDDFQPTEIVFRFPGTVESREAEATFKDIPLP